ncbi:MAG TPA: efflux RND transporter periplasmic adaptor subunit [Chloroflexota bacterium]|nr:efflux RND transporter periplasmic adaptor subunit [Chloroflexota bacterium]
MNEKQYRNVVERPIEGVTPSYGSGEMDGSKGGRTRGLGKLGLLLLGGLVVSASLWGFTTRAQGAEQHSTVSTVQGSAVVSVKTAQVAEGSISTSLNYSGDVKAVSQVTVLPKATGRIERLLVDVGSKAKTGDPIAELDAAALRVQVAQAKANLAAAQAKHASMQSGSRQEQITQAKAALEAAQARATTVKKGATENDLAAGQSAVDTAGSNLASARAAQDRVKIGATQAEMAAAQADVDASKVAILAAQAYLDDLKASPKDADLWAAQNAVDRARATLYAANDRVDTWKGTGSDAEKAAATQLPSVSSAVKATEAAQTALDAAVAALNQLKAGPTAALLQDAETKLRTAKTGYDRASARLEQLQRGATVQDQQQAQAAVDGAQAALAGAEARLKQLKDGPTEEDIKSVEAAVTQAEQAYQLSLNPYTGNDLAMSDAGVQQAQAAVELAEIGLAEAVIVAPVDGVVSEKLQSVGALVNPATPIVTLISGNVEMVLGVEEAQIGSVTEGQKAEISVAAYPGTVFPAKVAMISPAADPKTRTFQVKVQPEENGGKLRQGMYAQVKIVAQERNKVVLVPKDAVITKAGQNTVFVLKDDVAQARQVKLGLATNGTVEVMSGLQTGEEVVVAGQNELRDGDKVRKQ